MTNNMISSNNKLLSIRWIYLDDNFDWNHIDIYGENLEDESQLNKSFGFIKMFTNPDECIDYVTNSKTFATRSLCHFFENVFPYKTVVFK